MKRMSVDEIRETQMGIADEIHRICEEHGLTYYLSSGTLLGAARHKGFIPWDDDLDLMMLRADYDTLVENFDSWRHDERFEMLAPRKMNTPYYMAKVVDTATFVKQTYVRQEYCTGLWVDIFPLDWLVSDGDKVKRRCYNLKRIGYLSMTDPNSGGSLAIRLGKKLACPLVRLFTRPELIAREVDSYSRAQSGAPTDAVALYGGMRNWLLTYDYDWMKNTVLLPFEDREYFSPVGYDECLTVEYGDWRTPVERESHFSEAYWV